LQLVPVLEARVGVLQSRLDRVAQHLCLADEELARLERLAGGEGPTREDSCERYSSANQ
jgi:hypothetical protein